MISVFLIPSAATRSILTATSSSLLSPVLLHPCVKPHVHIRCKGYNRYFNFGNVAELIVRELKYTRSVVLTVLHKLDANACVISMLGELAALGAALCWTVSAALYKVALSDAKPVSANISRCISTTVFFIACLGATGRLQYLAALRVDSLLLAGLSGAIGLCVGDTLYMLSLKLIGVSRAVPVTCTYPLFTLLFATLFFSEQITLFVLLGAVLIIAGIWLISQGRGKSSGLVRKVLFKGILVAFVTAVVWAVSIAFMDEALALSELAVLDAAFVVNTVRLLATTFSLLAISPFFDRQFGFLKLKRRTWVILALGGIVALGLGWVLLAVSLLDIPASYAVPISSVSPLFATLFGAFLLKERVTARTFVGSVFIVLGTSVLFVV